MNLKWMLSGIVLSLMLALLSLFVFLSFSEKQGNLFFDLGQNITFPQKGIIECDFILEFKDSNFTNEEKKIVQETLPFVLVDKNIILWEVISYDSQKIGKVNIPECNSKNISVIFNKIEGKEDINKKLHVWNEKEKHELTGVFIQQFIFLSFSIFFFFLFSFFLNSWLKRKEKSSIIYIVFISIILFLSPFLAFLMIIIF